MRDKKFEKHNEPNLELECGNCWGYQQYVQGYRNWKIDHWKGKGLNFISKFLKLS